MYQVGYHGGSIKRETYLDCCPLAGAPKGQPQTQKSHLLECRLLPHPRLAGGPVAYGGGDASDVLTPAVTPDASVAATS